MSKNDQDDRWILTLAFDEPLNDRQATFLHGVAEGLGCETSGHNPADREFLATGKESMLQRMVWKVHLCDALYDWTLKYIDVVFYSPEMAPAPAPDTAPPSPNRRGQKK